MLLAILEDWADWKSNSLNQMASGSSKENMNPKTNKYDINVIAQLLS